MPDSNIYKIVTFNPAGKVAVVAEDVSCNDIAVTHAGPQMFDTTGRMGGVMLKPQNKFLFNATFGGPQFDALCVTCTDKVYRRKTKTKGVGRD